MTLLYQTMVWKLFCKDGVLLQKKSKGGSLTLQQFTSLQGYEIEDLMENEIQYLSYLAYKAIQEDYQVEFKGKALLDAVEELNRIREGAGDPHLPSQMLEQLRAASFLHMADEDPEMDSTDRAWHFLHLTSQEYFAAVWVARMLEMMQNPKNLAWEAEVNRAVVFVQHYKRNPGYEIVFQMVAGLLQCETLELFFELMQGSKYEMESEPYRQLLRKCWEEVQPQLRDKDRATAGKVESQFRIVIQADKKKSSRLDSKPTKPIRKHIFVFRTGSIDDCVFGEPTVQVERQNNSCSQSPSKNPMPEEQRLSPEERDKIGNDLLQKGDKYRDRGDFNDAIKTYKKALEYRRDEAQNRIGDAYIRKGDKCRDDLKFDDATKNYKKALEYSLEEAQNRLEEIPQRKRPADDKDSYNFMTKNFRSPWKRVKDTASMSSIVQHEPVLTGSYFLPPTPSDQDSMTQLILSTPPSATNAGSTSSNPSNTKDLVASFRTVDSAKQADIVRQIRDVVVQFEGTPISFDTVQELVVVATTPSECIFLQVINQMLKVLRDSPILYGVLLQGLAVVLNSCPDEFNFENLSGIFPDILRPLMSRLEIVRTDQNTYQLIPLLEVLNALLDTMVGRSVRKLDRTDIYEPLIALLDHLVTNKDDTVSFLAIYAKQTIAFIGDNESAMMNFFRRGKLVVAIAGNIATMAHLHRYNNVGPVLKDFAKLCDYTQRYAWYQGLLYVDCMIGLEDWSRFERFVIESKLNKNRFFLQGVCLRLEQIAATHANMTVRDGATRFLQSIEETFTGTVKKVAGGALERLKIYNDRDTPMTDATNPADSDARAFQDNLRPVWDPIWQATPTSTLFKAVRENQHQRDIVLRLPDHLDGITNTINTNGNNMMQTINDVFAQQSRQIHSHFLSLAGNVSNVPQISNTPPAVDTTSSEKLGQIHSALHAYYKPYITIQRVSGAPLELVSCYFNLFSVKGLEQQKRDKDRIQTWATTNSSNSMPSDHGMSWTNRPGNIHPEDLFDERNLPGGRGVPKKILIQGRAGIGKTTLCKRLVNTGQSGQWGHLFNAVLWIPLRQLRAFKARNIEDLLREKFFPHHPDSKKKALVADLAGLVRTGKVLFILDGLDEIIADTQTEENIALIEFLRHLLHQNYVIITSRPSGAVDTSILPELDLELETVGFSPDNINKYVNRVIDDPDVAKAVQKFIGQNPSIKDLVKIPVQLDVVCYSWDLLPVHAKEQSVVTMTLLYQTMVWKLFCKDGNRLGKKSGGESLTIQQFKRLRGYQIERMMENEIQYLSYLAYMAMQDDYQVEFKEVALLDAMEELDQVREEAGDQPLPLQLLELLKGTSFLHTADGDLRESAEQAWYFLHLTFQEYFAASWVARMLEMSLKPKNQAWDADVNRAVAFIQHHKRHARYDIVFQMVAGLLKCETLELFFEIMQGSKSEMESKPYRQLLARCWKEVQPQLQDPKNKAAAANFEAHFKMQMLSLEEQEEQPMEIEP
ncbi:hypothetical protein BGX26_003227 [Mortierella sp. AD094]|nr:hypothetical protein BGX26_003227 [Mortierella sp. AD094]